MKGATATYKHPAIKNGSVHQGDDEFAVKDGLVELPVEIGKASGWEQVSSASDAKGKGKKDKKGDE